ncbi:pilus assembly protein FimV [Polaromonas sp. CG_9.5]|uniref:FimV/HubP family polar landmark protein n=1 Tax=Polaromonas sp. CG_9.5 TaxID=3071705 RepID=UPI002E031B81|nr:pilus assembly protein FimV [Polaromonas sp. CG_9.5]
MNNLGRWRLGAMASAVALLGSMASLEAHAVALGRITVQSALGESLRAEIDVSDLSAEEASSLRVGVANADAFRAAGLEYPSAAAGMDITLQRRANGKTYLRLSSNRAINDPFVDLILEAKSSSGRITRDYTMLFDPPNLRTNRLTAAIPGDPAFSRAPVASATAPARETPQPYSPPSATRPVTAARAPVARVRPAEELPAGVRQVTVQSGDNASQIAAQNKPDNVSLNQMLVALLRSNPNAFVGGNINILKSGAVLDIPDAQAATALSPKDATRILTAQSADVNNSRRKIAQVAPDAQTDNAGRQIGNKVQPKVEDSAQASTTPDKLTLSKAEVQGKSAKDLEAKDAAGRLTELSKNITDLSQLGVKPAATTGTASPGTPVLAPGVSSATGTTATAAVPALPSASAADSSASPANAAPAPAPAATASESAAAAAARAVTAPAIIKPPVVVTPPPPESGLMDLIRDNTLILLGAGGVLVLLAGLGFARHRRNKKSDNVDSSFLDSRMQPDSFFGASGGRLIDTHENNPSGSSLSYSPSQLDAAGDVDPVAEADVYLAYGRDQQAEEILREALRTHPGRLAIHTKLLEIYAKRRDHQAFQSVALSAFKVSKGQGSEWAYITELGRDLDPENVTYQPDVGPSDSMLEHSSSAFMPVSGSAPLDEIGSAEGPKAKALDMDLDLDLDFSLDDAPATAGAAAATLPAEKPSASLNPADMNFDLNLDPLPATTQPVPTPPAVSASTKPELPDLEFFSEGLDFTPEPFVPPKPSLTKAAPISQSGMLEFDLNSLSLDLDPSTQSPLLPLSTPEEDPLEIKFLLAEEFRILGDADGARSLADEVVAKATGPLKVKAQAFLNAL